MGRQRLALVVLLLILVVERPAPVTAIDGERFLIEVNGVLRSIDAVTGAERWRLGSEYGMTSAVSAAGITYVSATQPGASETRIFAVGRHDSEPREIGAASGVARVKALSQDGERLWLLSYPADERSPFRPLGLLAFDLPDQRPTLAPAPLPLRDQGGAILRVTDSDQAVAEAYYVAVRVDDDGDPIGADLWFGDFAANRPPVWIAVQLPFDSGPFSLLATADGARLDVVAYGGQSVAQVDIATRSLVAATPFGDRQDKRPPCAAALSPTDDALWLLGPWPLSTTHALVLDSRSLTAATGYEIGQGLSCLAPSPDGERVYFMAAEGGCQIVAVDAATGIELSRIATGDSDDCGWLWAVV